MAFLEASYDNNVWFDLNISVFRYNNTNAAAKIIKINTIITIKTALLFFLVIIFYFSPFSKAS